MKFLLNTVHKTKLYFAYKILGDLNMLFLQLEAIDVA